MMRKQLMSLRDLAQGPPSDGREQVKNALCWRPARHSVVGHEKGGGPACEYLSDA